MAGPGFYQGSGNEAVTNLSIDQTLFWVSEHDQGNSLTKTALDMNKRNKMKYTLANSVTVTFSDDPLGPTSLLLRILHAGAGPFTITWPTNMKWPNGTAPTLSAGDGKIDIIAMYFDGTDYYGNVSLNFS